MLHDENLARARRAVPLAVGHSALTSKAVNAATYAGAGSAMFFGFTANEFAALVGAVVAVAGLICSQFWSWQKDRRLRAAIEAGKLQINIDE
jgi:hypothetical protein